MIELAFFSDIHLRTGHVQAITDELHAAITAIGERPAHAFVLGDLIEDDRTADVDAEHVERVRELFDAAPFPVTYLLGNHDGANLSRDRLSALLNQDEFFGRQKVDDHSVVFLDSTRGHSATAGGELGPAQREWLATTLASASETIVLSHHPMGNFDLSGNPWFEAYPERAYLHDRKEVLSLFASEMSVRGTFSGHIHETGRSEFRGLPHVSIGPFSKERPDRPVSGTYGCARVGETVEVDIMVRDTHEMTLMLD